MKLRKYRIIWGVLYEGVGKSTGEGVIKTCVKHLTMKGKERGYWDHPRTQKALRHCCICFEMTK